MRTGNGLRTAFIVVVSLSLGLFTSGAWAWGQNSPDAGVYGIGNSMTLGSVYEGTVVNVRPVRIESTNTATYTGRATGAALGGLLGSRIGQGNGRIATGLLGVMLGGVAGDAISDRFAGYTGTEIVIAVGDHRLVSVTQAGAMVFFEGEPVYVIESGGTTRVIARGGSQGGARYIKR